MHEQLTTKDKLLFATVEVIDHSGETSVRVRDIAARAGVKEPSVYHYFGSRDGLIEAAQAHRYSRGLLEVIQVFDEYVRSCEALEDFQNIIRRVIAAVVSPEREKVRAVRADVLGSAMTRPQLKRAVGQAQMTAHHLLANTISYAQEQGWVRPELNAIAFAAWYTGMVNGRVVFEIDPEQCDGAEWDAIAVETTLHLLRQK